MSITLFFSKSSKNGQIGDDLVIRSIPSETKKRLNSFIGDNHHVVIEKDKSAQSSQVNWASAFFPLITNFLS